MGKQSNKSKRENEELDLILQKLMQSFNQEDNDEDTDEEESSDPDDNAEFNQLLQQIMTGSNSASTVTNPGEGSVDEDEIDESEFITDEAAEEPEIVTEDAIIDEDKLPYEDVVMGNDEVINECEAVTEDEPACEEAPPSLYEKSTDENQSESAVDNVLQLMFSGSPTPASDIDPEPVEDVIIEDETIEAEKVSNDAVVECEIIEAEISEDEIAEAEISEDEIAEIQDSETEIIEDESLENEADECDITEDESDEYVSIVEDEEYFNEPDPINEDVDDIHARLITDPAEYTYDPLQNVLPNFTPAFVRVDEKDNVADNAAKSVNNIGASDAKSEQISLDSNDISLLLKFGYGEEVKSRIGEIATQKAIAEKNNDFSPESHQTPYGFCGKELTDKRDTRRIREKFKSDKTIIVIQIILISILTLVAFALEGFFEFISDRSSYLAVCAVEMVIIAIAFAVLSKKLISGILGIIRFEANIYSILAYLIFSYTLCNIITSLVYIIKAATIDTSGLMIFGLCILFYMLITLTAELLNCLRESSNFDLMRRTDRFYTAEKREKSTSEKSSSKIGAFGDENAYRLTRTSLIGGYFRKSSNSVSCNINLIYVIGVVPILSLIIGCVSALIGEDVMCGVYSMMVTTFLCIPFSYILVPSATEYVTSIYFRTKKIAFIGKNVAEDFAKTNALYFDDTDAIEIISYTEIHPSKSADGQKDLEIAQRVFASLGGPLAEFAHRINDSENEDSITKGEVVINSISENGIEIYFDSSTNILIGDKSYMNAHNIRVKTDSNLNSTIKGFDRSVIYMAFDGIPKLGFIVTSKIKSEFSGVASKLDDSGIKVFVDTYEPQINDLYFEQNKQDDAPSVSVCKSEEYESTDYKPICDGSVICSSDCYALADAIVECRNIVRRRKKNQRTHFALIVTGLFFSCLLTALLNVDRAIFIISGLKSHVSLVFNFIMLISLTPGIIGIVNTVKSLRRSKEKSKETK